MIENGAVGGGGGGLEAGGQLVEVLGDVGGDVEVAFDEVLWWVGR